VIGKLAFFYSDPTFAGRQPLSDWDSIFPDNIMALAAVDRLIHYVMILKWSAQVLGKKSQSKVKQFDKSGQLNCRQTEHNRWRYTIFIESIITHQNNKLY
jgi:hypothetical protein